MLITKHKIIYQIGEVVYLKTDEDQQPRMITGIVLRPNNTVLYYLTNSTTETSHFDIEISREKSLIFTTFDN